MENEKGTLSAGEQVKDEHRLNITLATNAQGWNTTVNGQLVIELAKNPRVKVSGLVPNSTQEQKEQAKKLNIELVDAKKRIGFSAEELLSFPPDSLDIDILIIHSYGLDLGKQAQVVKESKKCKWLHVVHTVSEELGKYMDKKTAGTSSCTTDSEHKVQLALCKEADIVIAIGPKVADAFKCALHHCGKHVINLTPSIIQELIDVRPHHEAGEVFRILISGTYPAKYFQVKGCDIAAKAIALLQDISLIFIITLRDDAQDLQNRLLKEGIKLNQFTVRPFHSSMENWRKLLCEVNLVIMPSRTEGFGTSSLRAISADLPVLVSGNSGLGMALKKLRSGRNHVVESDDPQDWADRITQVRAKDARDQLSEAKQLRREYMERFSWKDQCSNLVDKMMMMFPNKQKGTKKSVEHTEESEQEKSLGPKITSVETERVVYEENINFIMQGTRELGLADKNLGKPEKSGFDQVDNARVPVEYVPDKSSSADQQKSNRLSTKAIDIPYAVIEGTKKSVEHTEESEQEKSLEPKITSVETERVVYEENINFIMQGTRELGLADKNLGKPEKSGFDQVDNARVPVEYVPDKSSSADQQKSNRLSTKVIDIPYAVIGKICLKLNAKDHMFYKDYRLLGEKMGYSKDVTRDLERKDNPTDALLQLWSIKPEATVQNLIALLKDTDLDRMDVATILEDWVERKGSK